MSKKENQRKWSAGEEIPGHLLQRYMEDDSSSEQSGGDDESYVVVVNSDIEDEEGSRRAPVSIFNIAAFEPEEDDGSLRGTPVQQEHVMESEEDDGSLRGTPMQQEDVMEPISSVASTASFCARSSSVASTASFRPRSSSDSSSEDEAPELRAVSPLALPGPSSAQHPFATPVTPPVAIGRRPLRGVAGRGAAGRGTAGREAAGRGAAGRGAAGRGRGRGGRGRRGRGGLAGEPVSPWVLGHPMVEKFPRDEDLPVALSQVIGDLEKARAAREVAAREKKERADERTAAAALKEALDEDVVVEDEDEVTPNEDIVMATDEIGHGFDECNDFTWRPMEGWQPSEKEEYRPRRAPGPTERYDNPYDAFRSYWDEGILSHLATETNRYAATITNARFRKGWVDTNLDEILYLFAFWMLLGLVNMPSIRSCFSTSVLLHTSGFRRIFSRDRYWMLSKAFHLSRGPHSVDNPMSPMGPVMDHLNARFQDRYEPEQDICIDESLTLWKGPASFKQCIRTKAARFGIKTFELCESSTGYMYSFFVYAGGKNKKEDSSLQSSASSVLKLVSPRLDLGHCLYMDNWFNSPQLARFLKRRGTDCVGTLRVNRKSVPVLMQKAPLAVGEFVARQSGDVMAVTLLDRKRFSVLSTCHGLDQVLAAAKPGRPARYKLALCRDYNVAMGGVDHMDQMLEPYLLERKQCRKWTNKLFKRLLNVSIQNARILVEKSVGGKLKSLSFRLELVESILERHRPNIPVPRKRFRAVDAAPLPARLTERHFQSRILLPGDRLQTVNLGRAVCEWCKWSGGAKSKTRYECKACAVPLCGPDRECFSLYHTLQAPPPRQ